MKDQGARDVHRDYLDSITTDTDLIIQDLFYEANGEPVLTQNKGSLVGRNNK
jgi:hypothetical protein